MKIKDKRITFSFSQKSYPHQHYPASRVSFDLSRKIEGDSARRVHQHSSLQFEGYQSILARSLLRLSELKC